MNKLPMSIFTLVASLMGSLRVEEMHACGRKKREKGKVWVWFLALEGFKSWGFRGGLRVGS